MMYRVIHLDLYKSYTYEYVFNDLAEARKRFNEITEKHITDTVVLEDEEHNVLDHN